MVIQGHLILGKNNWRETSKRIGHIPHAVKTKIQRNESQTIFCVIDEKFGLKICCLLANLNLVPHHFLLSKIGPFCCNFFHSSLRNRFGIESCQVSFIFFCSFQAQHYASWAIHGNKVMKMNPEPMILIMMMTLITSIA